MVLIIRNGLRISLPVSNKFKRIDEDSLSNIWRFKQFGKSTNEGTSETEKKYFVELHAPWLKDDIFAAKNIGLEILMNIQIFILVKVAFFLEGIQRSSSITNKQSNPGILMKLTRNLVIIERTLLSKY